MIWNGLWQGSVALPLTLIFHIDIAFFRWGVRSCLDLLGTNDVIILTWIDIVLL